MFEDLIREEFSLEELAEKRDKERQRIKDITELKNELIIRVAGEKPKDIYEMVIYWLTVKDTYKNKGRFTDIEDFMTLYSLSEDEKRRIPIMLYQSLITRIAFHFNWNLEKQIKILNLTNYESIIDKSDIENEDSSYALFFIEAITKKKALTRKRIKEISFSMNEWKIRKYYEDVIYYGLKQFIEDMKQCGLI